jgi:hypothetical protein
MTYASTPRLLQTVAAVATGTAKTSTTPTSPPMATFTGAATGLISGAGMALSVAVGLAAIVL